jgi:hypothetical protein
MYICRHLRVSLFGIIEGLELRPVDSPARIFSPVPTVGFLE